MNAPDPALERTLDIVGAEVPHDSAALHCAGEAQYIDDLPEPRGMLHAALGVSPIARGRIRGLDLDSVRAAPGVIAVIVAADIPAAQLHPPASSLRQALPWCAC